MKITKFLNIDIEPAPPEMELEVEMQCREIMKSNDLDNIKRYCTHMIRKKFDQDVFMASMLNRLIELEANSVVKELRKRKLRWKLVYIVWRCVQRWQEKVFTLNLILLVLLPVKILLLIFHQIKLSHIRTS